MPPAPAFITSMLIDELLTQREGKTLDFKRDLSSMRGVLKDIIAFANTAGGLIVVGVDDDRTVVGLDNVDEAEEKLINAVMDSVVPQILINPQSTTYDGKELMLVTVVQAVQRPVHLKSKGEEQGSYVRIGSESRLADQARLEELRNFHAARTWDEHPAPGAEREDFDDDLAERVFTRRSEEFSEERMRGQRLLVDGNLGLVPSRAGLILFARDQTKHFSDARFRCATYPGTEKGAGMEDPIDFEGQTVLQSLDEVVAYIGRHTGLRTDTQGMDRVDFREYSIPTLREILHNAIAHADYNRPGQRLNVSIYSDRLEIENPGTFPPGMTVDDLKAGVSQVRNRAIAGAMHRLRYMEERGSAYARIRDEMEKGYPEPEWIEVGPIMRVILRPHPEYAARADEKERPARTRRDRAEDVIAYLAERGDASPPEIATRLGVSVRQARTYLRRLQDEGRIEPTEQAPQHPERRYRLAARK